MPATKEQCLKYRNKLRSRVRELLGYCCVVCGTERKIEYAHIKSTGLNGVGRGLVNRYLDIIKNPLCYVPMCHYHHVSFDVCEFELTLTVFLWGRNVVVYYPPRRSSNRCKRRRSNTNSQAEQRSSNCPF